MDNGKKIEMALKNFCCFDVLKYEKPIKNRSNCVFGGIVRRIDKDWNVVEDKIETWKKEVVFGENDTYATVIEKIREKCIEQETGDIPKEERENYTIHELCDWVWLEDENGQIVKKVETIENGEKTTKYMATIVKYAKILKDL